MRRAALMRRAVLMRHLGRLVLMALLAGTAGCTLLVDFDRSEIPLDGGAGE